MAVPLRADFLIASTYTIQGIVGIVASIILANIFLGIGGSFAINNPLCGLFCPAGQGPGQAGFKG